jgi:hypothetical protein
MIWVLTLLKLGGVSASDIVVHAIDGVRKSHIARLRSLGIDVVTVAPFDDRLPFANKLRQLTSAALDVDVAVLCDCDLAFSSDPSGLVPSTAIGAKIVDAGFPVYSVWTAAATIAGLDPASLQLGRAPQSLYWTYANNLNGGFLTLPRDMMAVLARAWPRWLEWVIEHGRGAWPLGQGQIRFGHKFRHHAFQISLGLCIAELELPVVHLPNEVNFTTMFPPIDWGAADPLVLHYHRGLTKEGLLRATGVDYIDRAIDAVNAVLTTEESGDLLADARAQWAGSLGGVSL